MRSPYILFFSFALLFSYNCKKQPNALSKKDLASWEIGPFTKIDRLNPILKPDQSLMFLDPVSGEETAPVFFPENDHMLPYEQTGGV
jgi:hypothetical protein